MADIPARDRRAAQVWMVKMLDDPVRHRQAFNAWIAGAPGRLDYYEGLLGDVQSADRAARDIRKDRPAVQRRSPRPALLPALGALALVAVLAFALTRPFLSDGSGLEDHSAITRTMTTQIGEVRTARLDDGSTIILDTNSQVSVQLSDASRRIDLRRGRARFIVAHDKARPFIVKAAGNEVIATGTMFDVTLQDGFGVQLLEGSVAVRLSSSLVSGGRSGRLTLHPGQQIRLADGQKGPASAMAMRPSDTQWVIGVKSFDAVPIRDVIAEANRYSSTQIVLADAELGERKIFGDIKIRDSDAVAQAIADYLHLRVDRSRAGMLVLTAEK